MFIRFALLLCVASLGGAELTPGTYQSTDGVYLTIDAQRAVLQMEDGHAIAGFRLVQENGPVACYHFGSPTGMHIEADPAGVATVTADERTVFAPRVNPPEAIGWHPYALPATEPDAAKRKTIAKELIRRFEHEQQLRHHAIAASGGRMDAETLAKPEVSATWTAINAADEENRRWLLDTIRTSGWIGHKSHGAQAHQALLLIALHNVSDLRLGATVVEQMQAERGRKELDESSVANIADRLALTLGDPLTYGIQAAGGADGRLIIPVIADAAQVDANRARIGQPPLATAAKMMQAIILRIDDQGRLVGEGAAEVSGLDAIDMGKAMADPAWGLAQAHAADVGLSAALTAADQGDSAPLAAWTKAAPAHHRRLLGGILQGLSQAGPDGDAEAGIVARRPVLEGFLTGAPAGDDTRILVANLLAYGLTARSAAPNDEELARAVTLSETLTTALTRPNISKSAYGHAITDTIACVRYRQGKLAEAAKLWQQAIRLAGTAAPELYRQRLIVAESGDPSAALPR